MSETALGDTVDRLSNTIANLCHEHEVTVATAESLTGGQLAAALSAAPSSGSWYCGGVVAYRPHVKFEVLHVEPGPVVNAHTAQQMAASVGTLMNATYTVGLTGVGGPDDSEGKPTGTVYLALGGTAGATGVQHFQFEGSPIEVMHSTIVQALESLIEAITNSV